MSRIFLQAILLCVVVLAGVSCNKSENMSMCPLSTYDYYDGIGDFHNIERHTYKDGLLDQVFAPYGWTFTMEYDKQHKLSGAKVYETGGPLLSKIEMVYKNNPVWEEIWRNGTTQEVEDHVFLTYNQRGNLLRNQRFQLEYQTDYSYYANGALKSWHIIDHGPNFAKGEYTYEHNFKNPYKSIKGPTYMFWFTNSGFGIGLGERWYTSEKITQYDENNEPYIYYDLDAEKTVWQAGQQNYPAMTNYVDKVSGARFSAGFEYECGGGVVTPSARRIDTGMFERSKVRLLLRRLRARR